MILVKCNEKQEKLLLQVFRLRHVSRLLWVPLSRSVAPLVEPSIHYIAWWRIVYCVSIEFETRHGLGTIHGCQLLHKFYVKPIYLTSVSALNCMYFFVIIFSC